MAPRSKVIEGEGERFELWWQWETNGSGDIWAKDTKHGGGIRTIKLQSGHPRPEEMDFVHEINELARYERASRTTANFKQRQLDVAVAALEAIMNRETMANAKLTETGVIAGETLNQISDMDYTAEDRK